MHANVFVIFDNHDKQFKSSSDSKKFIWRLSLRHWWHLKYNSNINWRLIWFEKSYSFNLLHMIYSHILLFFLITTRKKFKEYEIYNFLVFIPFCNSVTLNCSGNKIESLYHICFIINTRIWWIMNVIIQILAQQSCIWWFERCCKSLLWDPVPILQSLDKWWIDTHLRKASEIYDGRIHSIWKCPCKRFRNIFSSNLLFFKWILLYDLSLSSFNI